MIASLENDVAIAKEKLSGTAERMIPMVHDSSGVVIITALKNTRAPRIKEIDGVKKKFQFLATQMKKAAEFCE